MNVRGHYRRQGRHEGYHRFLEEGHRFPDGKQQAYRIL